jgi:hypothetical protein
MSESRWFRAKPILLGLMFLILVGVALGLGWWIYVWTQGANRLNATIASLDKQDPGWRWEELQAKRAAVPDAENGALGVEAAFKLLPKNRPSQPAGPDNESEQKSVVEQITDLEPNTQLNEEQIKELRAELAKAKPALDEARKLAGLPAGRYPPIRPEDVLSGGRSDYAQHPRPIANLLIEDSALLTQDQQPDAALASSRAILNAGRALGDDPWAIAQLVRIACRRLTVIATERILAQGQPSESALRASQQLLLDEEQQPLLLYALRGERAYGHEMMGWMETGDMQRLSGGTTANSWWQRLGIQLSIGSWFKQNHVRQLEVMSEAVEIAKLPADEQNGMVQKLHAKVKEEAKTPQNSGLFFATSTFESAVKISNVCARSRAELRCTIAALAAERYRLAHHAWPDSLDKLVPEFLPQVPIDPYDRKPLRYQRRKDGVAIYSVGPDGKDDGGKLDRKNYTAPGNDMVSRLWDVNQRRRPPATGKN